MRILVVGAGGIGGYLGARLLAAGRDATFLVRPHRVEQLRSQGLRLIAADETITLPHAPCVTAATLAGQPFDLILINCKSYDLASAIDDLAPAVGPGTMILPMLNGMAQLDALDARFGRAAVLGGATTLSAARLPDGAIAHLNTLDDVQFGDRDNARSARIHQVEAILRVPGIHSDLRSNILETMWHKWIAIAAATSATSLMRANMGDIVRAGHASLIPRLLAETASVAAAEGYPASQAYFDSVVARFNDPASLFDTSLHRDIQANARIEGDHMIGDMLTHAGKYNLQTPLLEIAYANLQCYEVRRLRESADRTAASASEQQANLSLDAR
jgi:2-dehydropantoate 2-reductase